MLSVLCTAGHYGHRTDANQWRHQRLCGCGEPTVIDYKNRCSHSAWRYPHPLPIDGDVCPDCGCEYVEPIRGMTEDRLEFLRGIGEVLAIIIAEAEGLFSRRDATSAIKVLYFKHFGGRHVA